jgi:hypothetical protein
MDKRGLNVLVGRDKRTHLIIYLPSNTLGIT